MTTKHTKGPWICYPSKYTDAEYCVYDCEENILTIDDEEHYCNSALISASPDMLDVLLRSEHLFTSIDGTTIENEKLYDDYKSAISKATGEIK